MLGCHLLEPVLIRRLKLIPAEERRGGGREGEGERARARAREGQRGEGERERGRRGEEEGRGGTCDPYTCTQLITLHRNQPSLITHPVLPFPPPSSHNQSPVPSSLVTQPVSRSLLPRHTTSLPFPPPSSHNQSPVPSSLVTQPVSRSLLPRHTTSLPFPPPSSHNQFPPPSSHNQSPVPSSLVTQPVSRSLLPRHTTSLSFSPLPLTESPGRCLCESNINMNPLSYCEIADTYPGHNSILRERKATLESRRVALHGSVSYRPQQLCQLLPEIEITLER